MNEAYIGIFKNSREVLTNSDAFRGQAYNGKSEIVGYRVSGVID